MYGPGIKDGTIEIKVMDIKNNILDKYKNVSAISFSTFNKELVVSFDGFENEEDIREFADFLFSKIKMKYWHSDKVPTYH